jgi:hypothetical protein
MIETLNSPATKLHQYGVSNWFCARRVWRTRGLVCGRHERQGGNSVVGATIQGKTCC